MIRLLGDHPLTSPELTGGWEHRLGLIEQGADSRDAFIGDIVKFTTETVQELDKLKGVRIERANLGPCPVCGRDIIENRKGYSCWSKDDPGCGFVIWKKKAGKILPVSVVRELMATGKTEKQVTGFRGRSGRTFRVKGRGVPKAKGAGDLLVTVEVAVPAKLSSDERKAVEALAAATSESPRSHLGV